MADTADENIASSQLLADGGVTLDPKGLDGGDENMDIDRKMDQLSPRKRDRAHVQGNEDAESSSKRQKGVAPIKAE